MVGIETIDTNTYVEGQIFEVEFILDVTSNIDWRKGTDISRELGNQAGGLPFTVLIDTSGNVRQTYLGRLNINKVKSDLNDL